GSVTAFPLDVLETSALEGVVNEVQSVLGPVDILVNSAGTNIQQLAVDVDEASWDAVLDLNLRSSFFATQTVARHMIKSGRGGRIVNLSSQIGEVGFYKRAAYAA